MGNIDETNTKTPIDSIRRQIKTLRTNTFLILAPGNKNFKDISKRLRLMFLSALIPLVLAAVKVSGLTQFFPFIDTVILNLAVATVLSILSFFATIWALKFQLRKESYYSVLHLSPLFVFTSTTMILTLFPGELNRLYLLSSFILVIGIFMILYYIVLMAVNVLNVNLFYVIPLSKLGESIQYLSVVFSLFMLYYATYNAILYGLVNNIPLIVTLWAGLSVVITLISILATLFYYMPVQSATVTQALILTTVITIITGSLLLFVPYTIMAAVLAALNIYVLLGTIIHQTQNTLKMQVYLEYGLVYILIIGSLLFVQ